MTLRQLFWMAESRRREAWDHTSQVLALLFNVNRNPKTPAVQPSEFHPFSRPAARKAPLKMNIRDMRSVFCPDAGEAKVEQGESIRPLAPLIGAGPHRSIGPLP